LEQVSALIDSGSRGIVFVGVAGVGKTRLALETLNALGDRGFATFRVSATEAMSNIPLGQFATLLPKLEPGTPLTEALRKTALVIKKRAKSNRIAFFVDDMHLLDEASALLTQRITADGDVFLLGTIRSTERSPDPVISLWKDEVVSRVDLCPLSPAATGDLLELILRGPLEAPTRRALVERSAGNMLFLRELVTTARESGALVQEDGLWHLDGKLTASTRLIELVEARLSNLTDDERTALELVALGEPLSIGLFERLVTLDAQERLEARQLLRGDRDGRRLELRLAHPMYGEALRATLSSTKRRALYRSLAAGLLELGARRQSDLLNLATWSLEGGGSIDGAVMLEAAHRAWMLRDFPLARELATAASRSGAGFDAELLIAQLHITAARPQEAERMMSLLARHASDDGERTRLATARIENLCYNLFDLEAAMSVAAEAELSVTDTACKDELATFVATLGDMRGNTSALLAVADLSEHSSGRAQAWACLIVASGYARTGRLRDAQHVAERGFEVHAGLGAPGLPWGPDMHTAEQAWAHALLGELAEAESIAFRAVAQGEWMSGWSLAIALNLQGRATEAARWARETAIIARRHGQAMVSKLALIQLVEALALTEQLDEADKILSVLRGDRMSSVRNFDAEVHRVHGWVEVVRGDLGQARTHFSRAAAEAAETGEKTWELAALYDLARVDLRSIDLERLVSLGETIEGPLTACRVAHVRARAAADAIELGSVSAAFEELGCILLAAESSSHAGAAWEQRGRSREAAAAERRANDLARRCDGATTPALKVASGARSQLAPRQLEIARLAARGIPNKSIARKLGLSLRTVENRLHETYAALGIGGREDLEAALSATD
jgi:DNA-binding CsgD family transcriptional regulator